MGPRRSPSASECRKPPAYRPPRRADGPCRHVGQFIYLWEVVTAYAGRLLNIDAYDQPAVETGKQATFGLMGRKGYEKFKTQVEQTLAPTKWVIG